MDTAPDARQAELEPMKARTASDDRTDNHELGEEPFDSEYGTDVEDDAYVCSQAHEVGQILRSAQL